MHAPVGIHKNNFDFLRLFLASLVIFSHSYFLLNRGEEELLYQWTKGLYFSELGVYGFFVISGYLIYQSLERSSSVKSYLKKRIRRVFPALFVVVLLSTFILGSLITDLPLLQYFSSSSTWLYWLMNSFVIPLQGTLPGVFQENFLPAVNGSLWTLRYEFLFYGVITLFFWSSLQLKKIAFPLLSLLCLFIVVWFEQSYLSKPFQGSAQLYQLFKLGFFFSIGMCFSVFAPLLLKRRTLYFAIAAVVFILSLIFYAQMHLFTYLSFPLLIIFFGTAYIPFLNYSQYTGDISYGTYIYAFPIQQTLIFLGITNVTLLFFSALLLSWLLGYISWQMVEKRFVRRKGKNPIKSS